MQNGKEIMLITNEGIIIRIGVDDISKLGRVTSGVKLMNLDSANNIRVASIAKVREDDIKEEESEEETEVENEDN